jgi:hypothetical protein
MALPRTLLPALLLLLLAAAASTNADVVGNPVATAPAPVPVYLPAGQPAAVTAGAIATANAGAGAADATAAAAANAGIRVATNSPVSISNPISVKTPVKQARCEGFPACPPAAAGRASCALVSLMRARASRTLSRHAFFDLFPMKRHTQVNVFATKGLGAADPLVVDPKALKAAAIKAGLGAALGAVVIGGLSGVTLDRAKISAAAANVIDRLSAGVGSLQAAGLARLAG